MAEYKFCVKPRILLELHEDLQTLIGYEQWKRRSTPSNEAQFQALLTREAMLREAIENAPDNVHWD